MPSILSLRCVALVAAIGLVACLGMSCSDPELHASIPHVELTNGVTVAALSGMASPHLAVLLPGEAISGAGVRVELPERIKRDLYLIERGVAKPGRGHPIKWRSGEHHIGYELSLVSGVTVRVRVEADGDSIAIAYVVENHSSKPLMEVSPVTCVQLGDHPRFADPRLERTYVAFAEGFELLAAEVPERLELPLQDWRGNPSRRFRARYLGDTPSPGMLARTRLASDSQPGRERYVRVYYASRRIAQPVIATASIDGEWVIATHSPSAPEVWDNPFWTCQHADPIPQSIPAGETRSFELRVFVFQGSVEDVSSRIR